LSGNRFIAALTLYTLCSCNLIRNTTRASENPAREKNDTALVERKETIIEKQVYKTKEPNLREVYFHGKKYLVENKQEIFQIALILPFNVGLISANDKKVGDIMFEYYQGFLTSVNMMETSGLNLKLHVFDSRSDSIALTRILRTKKLKEMDVIIGPITDNHMCMVSEFGKKNNIPVFSPFTPVDDVSDTNNLFYNFNISHKNKAVELVKYIKKHHKDDKLFIVRDGKKYDKEFVPTLLSELSRNKMTFTIVPFGNTYAWSNTLSALGNLVYVPSLEKNVVSVTMGNIYGTRKSVTVLGEYKWIEFQNNDFSFWNELNVHLLTNSYIDYLDSSTFEFRDAYRLSFKKDPTDYSFTGFNQGKFICDALMAFGDKFHAFVNGRTLAYFGTCYYFSLLNGINQNRHLWVLKFQDYKLIPVKY
jgi:hypothetical protein